MEFQNEPFQALKARVETLEQALLVALDALQGRIEVLEDKTGGRHYGCKQADA